MGLIKNVFFIFLFVAILSSNSFADVKYLTPEEQTIYQLITTAYTKEANIYYEFNYINKKFNGNLNILEVVNRHQKNMQLLAKIMKQYDVELPAVPMLSNIDITSQKQVCEEGLLLEKELASFYSDGVQSLSNMQQNETIGMLISTFTSLGDNSDFENSHFFKKCSSRIQ